MSDASPALAVGLIQEVRSGARFGGGKLLVLLSLLTGFGLTVLLSPLAGARVRDGHRVAVQEPTSSLAALSKNKLLLPATARSPPRNYAAQPRPRPWPSASGREIMLRPAAAMKSSGATESSAADAPAEVVGGQVVADPRIKLNPLQRRFALAFAGILAVSPFFVGMTGLLQPEALRGDASVMRQRAFGTCLASAPSKLRWNAAVSTADRISCFNRAAAEYAGYWRSTDFLKSESAASGEITFYDTISGKPLFIAPRGRTFDEFVAESNKHGWPSFRDQEVVAENVRVLSDGETVSADGTHLGHNLPDMTGNRYCINIVSIAGFGDQKN